MKRSIRARTRAVVEALDDRKLWTPMWNGVLSFFDSTNMTWLGDYFDNAQAPPTTSASVGSCTISGSGSTGSWDLAASDDDDVVAEIAESPGNPYYFVINGTEGSGETAGTIDADDDGYGGLEYSAQGDGDYDVEGVLPINTNYEILGMDFQISGDATETDLGITSGSATASSDGNMTAAATGSSTNKLLSSSASAYDPSVLSQAGVSGLFIPEGATYSFESDSAAGPLSVSAEGTSAIAGAGSSHNTASASYDDTSDSLPSASTGFDQNDILAGGGITGGELSFSNQATYNVTNGSASSQTSINVDSGDNGGALNSSYANGPAGSASTDISTATNPDGDEFRSFGDANVSRGAGDALASDSSAGVDRGNWASHTFVTSNAAASISTTALVGAAGSSTVGGFYQGGTAAPSGGTLGGSVFNYYDPITSDSASISTSGYIVSPVDTTASGGNTNLGSISFYTRLGRYSYNTTDEPSGTFQVSYLEDTNSDGVGDTYLTGGTASFAVSGSGYSDTRSGIFSTATISSPDVYVTMGDSKSLSVNGTHGPVFIQVYYEQAAHGRVGVSCEMGLSYSGA